MTPCSEHRYFLPRHGLVVAASWPRPTLTGSRWIRARLYGLLFGGPTPGSPETSVDPEALSAAVQLIEEQDIDGATRAFTDLGYNVMVHAPR
ncbi:hypothetical protein [Arthrobacter terrae]|nr:hypothetical protein [Arthrobacter terrae]